MALQKRFTTKKGKEIIVTYENKRFMVKHTEISQNFVTADIALDNYLPIVTGKQIGRAHV